MAQWEPIFWGGQEGFSAFAVDTPQDLADGTISTAPLTHLLVGYGNVPGYTYTPNTRPVRSAGAYAPVAYSHHRAEYTVDNSLVISTGANCLKFLQAAVRTSGTTVFPAINKYQCLPVISYMGGFIGACDTARDAEWLARACMFNTLTMSFSQGAEATAQFQLWPLAMDFAPSATVPTVTPAAIATAGDVPYVYQNMLFNVGSNEDSPGITSLTITVNNNLRRKGTRQNANGILANAARSINVGPEDISIQVTLDATPAYSALAALGNISVVLSDGTTTRTIALSGVNFLQSTAQNSNAPDADPTFTAAITGSQLTIS